MQSVEQVIAYYKNVLEGARDKIELPNNDFVPSADHTDDESTATGSSTVRNVTIKRKLVPEVSSSEVSRKGADEDRNPRRNNSYEAQPLAETTAAAESKRVCTCGAEKSSSSSPDPAVLVDASDETTEEMKNALFEAEADSEYCSSDEEEDGENDEDENDEPPDQAAENELTTMISSSSAFSGMSASTVQYQYTRIRTQKKWEFLYDKYTRMSQEGLAPAETTLESLQFDSRNATLCSSPPKNRKKELQLINLITNDLCNPCGPECNLECLRQPESSIDPEALRLLDVVSTVAGH